MGGRLAGKTAIITGAASRHGMGFATARLFAAEGASVLLTDINGPAAAEGAAAIVEEGGKAVGLQHDVSVESSWDDIVGAAIRQYGAIDVLVNNAGIYRSEQIAQASVATFDALVAVNLRGTFLGCRSVIPHMRKQGGSIVNVSSVAALVGVHGSSGYCATKGAVRSMTKAIALDEAQHGIRCNSIHPGTIDTEMVRATAEQLPEAVSAMTAAIPLGRLGKPIEVARASLFLASEESSFVTGAELVVDGGQIIQ